MGDSPWPQSHRVVHTNVKCSVSSMLTNIFYNIFAGMGFNHGDRVNMFVAAQKVASGSVCEIDPNAYCSRVLIGEGNVSVSIDLCFQKNIPLPFPTMDALTVLDAFHSIVRWSIGSLKHMHVMQQEGTSMPKENVAIETLEEQFDGLSYRRFRRIGEFSYEMKEKHD